jgi:hypothetical protein
VIIEHRKTRRGQPKSRGRVFVLGCSRRSGHIGVKVPVRDCRITSLTLDPEETTVAEGWSLEWRPGCEGVGPRKFRQDVTSVVELGETPENRFAPDGSFLVLRTSVERRLPLGMRLGGGGSLLQRATHLSGGVVYRR